MISSSDHVVYTMETETSLMCKIGELENSFFDVTNRLTDSIWQIQLWCPWSKFQPYSILTRDTRVEFVIYCVLKTYSSHPCCWGVSTVHFNSIFIWSPFLKPFLSVDFVGENGHPSDNSNTDQKGQKGGEGVAVILFIDHNSPNWGVLILGFGTGYLR